MRKILVWPVAVLASLSLVACSLDAAPRSRSSVRDMAEHNKKMVESTHDQIVAEGYAPCKRCNP